jgi:hypothetical protein
MMAYAKAHDKCFYSSYQALWFTAEQLQESWDRGQFRWGACNWQLRDKPEAIKDRSPVSKYG